MKLIQYLQYKQSYDDEPLPGYQQILVENRNYGESWGEHAFDGGNVDETVLSDYRTPNASSRKGFPPDFMNCEVHVCPADDQVSVAGSCVNNSNVFGSSPGPDYFKRRRNSMGEIRSVSSCNKCRPAIISSEPDGLTTNGRKSNIVVPLTDSHSSLHSHPRNKGLNFSWLFPRLKKKNKNESSPVRSQAEEVPQMVKDSGTASVETLRKELTEANESRDAALNEVAEMKSSLEEFSQKLEYLETYCEELKKALRQAVQVKISLPAEKLINPPRRGKSIDGIAENSMPVSDEVMVEGFLQIVSEARLSVKQFCKTLLGQLDETDHTLVETLNLLLQPYKLSLNTKYSKAVLYHLEAIINQSLYQDFENCVFQKNGAQKLLDPQQDRQARFQSFVALRNLSWNEVLRKGTKFYSEEFSKYCDKKMSGIITTLGWTRPWSEQLLQAFFVAAKCIWLLHLLAFSFNQPLGILRVDENVLFESDYMEDIFADRQRSQGPGRVKIMVMPGFYVLDRVLKCKVLCRYKSVS
ncbi:UNVERIFIED_CONTAM: IRK-interacting protein [Sesamum angustifolium]|uniref:IRK-interacting protein n=1 Tax=Sesamum angustifolium TaxID=2727405 RepID=A0AAW2IZQ8_9LAMI